MLPSLCEEAAEADDDRIGFAVHPRAGNADHLDAGQLEVFLTPTVDLKRHRVSMMVVRVEFNGEALDRPVGIELESVDEEIHRRLPKPGAANQGKEATLKARAGEGLNAVKLDRFSQSGDASKSPTTGQQAIDRVQVEQIPLVGPLGHIAEKPWINRCEVEERSWNRGHRNSLEGGAILWLQRSRAVNLDRAASFNGAGGSDLDYGPPSRSQPPEPGGGAVTEKGAAPAAEHRGKTLSMAR